MKSKKVIFALTLTVMSAGFALSTARAALALEPQADESTAVTSAQYAPMAPAMPPHMVMWEMRAQRMKAFMADLNLTDAQIEKLAQLKRDFRAKAAPIHAKLCSLKEERHYLLLQSEIDPDKIVKVGSQIEAQKKVFDGCLTDYLISKAQVLTSDQRHKIELAMDKLELRHFGGHHHEHEGFGGGHLHHLEG